MSLVLDGSVALSWCFEDERTPATAAVLQQVVEEGAAVPALWRLEVANGLQVAVRRGRITPAFRDASLRDLGALAIAVDGETERHAWSTTLGLAERFRLSLYDAAYLEAAARLALPLATIDRALAAAAGTLGISVLGAG